jgi:bifunctional N-acetylglucosamine-1-phosphate-uridyltransferase/glucosamine-1-phosphate-acetyltransferase GlmU-like protein
MTNNWAFGVTGHHHKWTGSSELTHVVVLAGRPRDSHEVGDAEGSASDRPANMIERVIRTPQLVISRHSDRDRRDTSRHGSYAIDWAIARTLDSLVQEPQLGTAHALQQAEPCTRRRARVAVLLSGDVPLLSPDTLKRPRRDAPWLRGRSNGGSRPRSKRPYGYGRIVRRAGEYRG